MTKQRTVIDYEDIREMWDFLKLELKDSELELASSLSDLRSYFYPLKVKESAFGDNITARNMIYKVELCSGREMYAVDGGFLLDPITKRFSPTGNPQKFKAVYPDVPNEDLADKVHLYLVAKICENARAIPCGGAEQLAVMLGIDQKYKLVNIYPRLIALENVN